MSRVHVNTQRDPVAPDLDQRVSDEGNPPHTREPLLTLDEAAEVLRLHRRTVADYARRGELDGRLIGGRWRFRRAALDAFYDKAPRWRFAVEPEDQK